MPYMSRIALRREPGAAGSLTALLAEAAGARYAEHRLVWTLFAGTGDEARDFVFRAMGRAPGRYLVVSQRAPRDPHGIWRIESKPYPPEIGTGRRLRFSLRANPVVTVNDAKGQPRRHDVVMHAKSSARRDGREVEAAALIAESGRDWLEKRAARLGFTLHPESLTVDGYQRLQFSHPDRPGGRPVVLGSLDFEGELTVADAGLFGKTLLEGVGRGKAFGFGLLLVRRPRRE